MDELYRIHDSFSCPNGGGGVVDLVDHGSPDDGDDQNINLVELRGGHGHHEVMGSSSKMSDLLKAQIANHPLYPNLVSAYVECRKVGAPPEMASILEEISKENHPIITSREIGADPELDQFMESYCEALHRYKEELLKPFDEATTFLNNIESQLNILCRDNFVTAATASSLTSATCHSDEAANGSSEEDLSCGEVEVVGESHQVEYYSGVVGGGQAENQLKEMLMRKYSGYLSTLRKEFLKKRKKGKLPKDARMALLDWWNTHYRWPYPTEEEKNKLSEVTGLDQKQINNWFINQRKRHWKPSEDMRFALMHGVGTAGISGPVFFDAAGGNNIGGFGSTG